MTDTIQSEAGPRTWHVVSSELDDGTWHLRLAGGQGPLKVEASHQHRTIAEIKIAEDGETRVVTVDLPRRVLSDGLQSVHLVDKTNGTALASLHISAGARVALDLAAELALLRDEMDLLKRALRRILSD